jgi:hypothetical protein
MPGPRTAGQLRLPVDGAARSGLVRRSTAGRACYAGSASVVCVRVERDFLVVPAADCSGHVAARWAREFGPLAESPCGRRLAAGGGSEPLVSAFEKRRQRGQVRRVGWAHPRATSFLAPQGHLEEVQRQKEAVALPRKRQT